MSPVVQPTPVNTSPITDLLRRIDSAYAPLAIWLFGSRARGTEDPESDWDLLVVVPDEAAERGATDPMAAWELRRQARVRADIIVCSASDFEGDRTVPNTLAFEASHFGVLLP